MNRNIKRLSLSLALSLGSALLTHYWYKSVSSVAFDYGDKKPVAQLIEAVNEVQRKPLKRLVWRSLSTNESLYSGELIRTTEDSAARIVFPQTGTEINLEPDSMILIGDDGDGLTLEFMKGFLQVKGGAEDKLRLKSGNNQISLAGTELSLGKAETGPVQLQILKGNPKIEGTDFQQLKENFTIIKPTPNSTIHIQPTGDDFVNFEWKQLEKDFDLILEAGKSRKEMIEVPTVRNDLTKAMASLATGDYYYRLIAKPKDSTGDPIVSNVYRMRILPKRPPVAIFPTPDKVISSTEKMVMVPLRWANPGQLEGVVIQVSTSSDLKANLQVLKSDGPNLIETSLATNKTYFWRLTGYLPESNEAVTGPIYSFTIKEPDQFQPPALISPSAAASISQNEANAKGVVFRWQTANGAQGYQVKIKGVSQPQFERTIPNSPSPLTNAIAKDLPPGEYEWHVTSVSNEQQALAPTASRKFQIMALTRIEWLTDVNELTYLYGGEAPEFQVGWKNGPKETAKYKLTWRDVASETPAQEMEVDRTAAKVAVPNDGRYSLFVEGISAKGEVVAKSSELFIAVKASPQLPAPILAEGLPDPLKALRSGLINLNWTQVDGATEYVLEIKTATGDSVRVEKSANTKYQVSKLLPGDYKVTVRGVDKTGRRGLASSERPLVVPPVSDVSAPTMKRIKVE